MISWYLGLAGDLFSVEIKTGKKIEIRKSPMIEEKIVLCYRVPQKEMQIR